MVLGVSIMKTEVNMKRDFMGGTILQRSKSEFFSSTDLIKIGNKWRLDNDLNLFDLQAHLKTKQTKIFTDRLENRVGKIKIMARGRGTHTWVHPFLFIDIALAINPEFKIDVYEWLFDHLLKYKNESGASYNKMSGALMANIGNRQTAVNYVTKTARLIKKVCNDADWNYTNENILWYRDTIHNNISLLADVLRDNDRAVITGIDKATRELRDRETRQKKSLTKKEPNKQKVLA